MPGAYPELHETPLVALLDFDVNLSYVAMSFPRFPGWLDHPPVTWTGMWGGGTRTLEVWSKGHALVPRVTMATSATVPGR